MAPLFVPGPVDVDHEVLAAQTQAMLPHRSAEFEEIFHRAEGKVRQLFFTESRVFITASSGTGLQRKFRLNITWSTTRRRGPSTSGTTCGSAAHSRMPHSHELQC